MRIALIAGGAPEERRWIEEAAQDVGQVLTTYGATVLVIQPDAAASVDVDVAYALDTTTGVASSNVPFELRRSFRRRHIPLIGPNSKAFSIARDKSCTRKVLSRAGLPIPPGYLYSPSAIIDGWEALPFPVVVKPAFGSGGRGIAVATNPQELEDILAGGEEPVVIEQYLQGREFTVSVITDRTGAVRSLEPIEITLTGSMVFDYAAKMDLTAHTLQVPPRLDLNGLNTARRLAEDCAALIGAPPFSRVDMLLTETGYVVLEINGEPLLSKSDFVARSARASGLSYEALILSPLLQLEK